MSRSRLLEALLLWRGRSELKLPRCLRLCHPGEGAPASQGSQPSDVVVYYSGAAGNGNDVEGHFTTGHTGHQVEGKGLKGGLHIPAGCRHPAKPQVVFRPPGLVNTVLFSFQGKM